MTSRLCVILNGAYAADIEHRARRPTLTYRPDYLASAAVPLSARFPLSRRQTGGAEVRRWLLNLLPDDDNVLNYLRTEYGAAARDPLRLLETPMGSDCAGAVQFCLPEALDTLMTAAGGTLPIGDGEIADWLNGYPVVPAAQTLDGATLPVTFSLAGMQPKIALRLADDGTWARTWGRTPTTHIIKAARADFADECVFEHLTMSTARRLGVPAASTAAADIGGVQTIIVTRFDRASRGQVRIHQEDSCQALGLAQTDKYENLGGPGASDLRRLAQTGGPATERNVARLRDSLLYRWLAVDSDAHAKNYSWMFDEAGDMHLAPLYDSSSWLPFRRGMAIGDIPLAMRMGRGSRISECDTSDGLTGLADSLRLPRRDVCERASEMAEALPTAIKAAAEGLPPIGFDWGRVEEHVAEIDVRADLCRQLAEQTQQKIAARQK